MVRPSIVAAVLTLKTEGPRVEPLPKLTFELKVVTPLTFTSSNSVCPSTSKDPLASMAPVNVDTPDTFTSSSSVCPLTSNFPIGVEFPIPMAFEQIM